MSNNLDGFVCVGKVRDSHGLRGELFVVTSLDNQPPWVGQIDFFKLQVQMPSENGKHKVEVRSFQVKKTRAHKKGFIVKSVELASRNESDAFIGASFFIDSSFLQSQKGENIYLKEVLGFEVISDGKKIGAVIGFSSNNAQDLLVVKTNSSEVEIPFVQAFVEQIDTENKCIRMNLPEGLLEVSSTPIDPSEIDDE